MQERVFRTPPTIHVGINAAAHTGPEAIRLGVRKALFITDSYLASSGAIQPVFDSLAASNVEIFLYDKVNSEPTLAVAEHAKVTHLWGR